MSDIYNEYADLCQRFESAEITIKRLRTALETIACVIADMQTSKDFDTGNVGDYLDTTHRLITSVLNDGSNTR